MTKQEEMTNLKKTAAAHGTLSEKVAEVKALDPTIVTEEIISEVSETPVRERKVYGRGDKKGGWKREGDEISREQKAKIAAGSTWQPKTKLGQEVKDGKIKSIDEILESNRKILEEQIVDVLLDLKADLISIGQAKGKFGGGKRRAWRQTQKKTKEGNIAVFSTMAVVGDENGHVGIGMGRAKETLPARDKAERKARLNIIKIRRGCASFDCDCSELHTVPFRVTGKMGSVKVMLTPAPQGTGLVAGNELKKILKLAGIKDVYCKTYGKIRTTFNLIGACFDALDKTNAK